MIQRFEVTGTLGTGAMGTVYRAHDPQLARDVAIKLLQHTGEEAFAEIPERRTLDLRDANTSTASLLDEARMMARLSHPNVVAVYEVGQHEGAVFVVMELVEGTDLRAWLAQPRAATEIASVFAQAGRGLAAAHAHQVVHRDFKPDNVLIGNDGRVRVADFGLSRLALPTGLVRDAGTAGTPRYLAPEIWAGRPSTTAADVYAFCVAYVEAFDLDGRADDAAVKLRATAIPARDAVIAGLAADPAARASMETIVRALERRPRSRALWLGGGALAAVAAGTAIALASGSSKPSCDLHPVGEGWEAARQALIDKLGTGDLVEDLDEIATLLATERVTTCKTVTDPVIRARRESCVTRRAIELVAWTRNIVGAKPDAEVRAPYLVPASCIDIEAPPIADAAALPQLYARVVKVDAMKNEPGAVEAAAIVVEATKHDERELACRAHLSRATKLRAADHFPEVVAAFEEAYNCALAIKSTRVATVALVEQAMAEVSSKHFERGLALAQTAIKQVDSPALGIRDRVAAYRAVGRAHIARGAYAEAIEPLKKGVAIASTSKRGLGESDVIIRIDLAQAMYRLDNNAESLAFGLDVLDRATKIIGPQSRLAAAAAQLVANMYAGLNERALAVQYARQGVAILTATTEPGHSLLRDARTALAANLHTAGDAKAAHDELAAVFAIPEKGGREQNVSIARARFAWTTFDIGDFDRGLEMLDGAISELTSDRGLEHPTTLKFRAVYAELLIESGKYDEALREIAAVEAIRAKLGTNEDRREAAVATGTLRPWILRGRNKSADGEPIAKRAIAALTELKAPAKERAGPASLLAAIYADLGRYDEAETLARALVDEAKARKEREDAIARLEVTLARAELGLGRRDEALARARNAQAILDRYPGQRTARAEVARLLAAKPTKPKRTAKRRR